MSGYLAIVWEWVSWGFKGLLASIWSLWLSPTVWPALALYGFLGFFLGHLDGAAPVKGMNDKLAAVTEQRDRAVTERNALKGQLLIAQAKASVPVVAVPVVAPAVLAKPKPKAKVAEKPFSLF